MELQKEGVIHEIGVAMFIASILGFTIDTYLRQNIAKDAFGGAMGYFLPDDIKEAVRYLGATDWFAEEFSLTIKLERVQDDLVKCTIKIRKFLRNVSSATQKINSYIHIDEWSHSKSAYIVSCSVSTPAKKLEMTGSRTANNGYTLHGETEYLSVYPGSTVETLGEAVEYKKQNDDMHYVLAYCARSPKIYVEAPDDFELLVGISAAREIQKHPHTNLYELPGFYLPWQKMGVRWYPKQPPSAQGVAP
jgi:hypothetical protein